MHDFDTEYFLKGSFDILNTRVAKLEHISSIHENNVVMLLILVGAFKVCCILAKLMFSNKVTRKKQIDSIVKRGAGNTVLFVLHVSIERLYIKMPRVIVDFTKYGIALGCFPMFVLLQISSENSFDLFL